MKSFLLLIVIISLCLNIQARMVKQNQCPNSCGCPQTLKPVCGVSGRTHGNLCLANCAGDKVAADGACRYKCQKVETGKVVKKCVLKVFGRSSYRKQCCTWTQLNGKRKNTKCVWVGEAVTVKRQSKCSWIKLRKFVKQRRCCKWTVRTQGKIVKKSKMVCQLVGKPIKRKPIKKFGCAMRTFGRFGRRRFCCKAIRLCHGVACKDVKKKCSFVGPIYIRRQRVKCHWVRRNGHSRQNKCCTFERKCVVKGKTRKCKNRKVGCHFRGPIIRTKRISKCHRRKFGRFGTRTRCCSWNTSCNLKKQCRKVRVRCSWRGPTTYQYLKSKCQYKRKTKNTKQRFCCSWKKTCLNKKCKNSGRKCQWIGQLFVFKKNLKCFWIKIGPNTRRRRCCRFARKCVGKKCKQLSKRCKFMGSAVSKKVISRCAWKRYARFQMRKQCCLYQKKCNGKKCRTEKGLCRWMGYIITKKVGRKCAWKRVGRFAKRLRCCNSTKKCHSKFGRCKVLKRKCHWSSKVIRKIPKKFCSFRSYGNKSSRRKKCCTWTNYCIGKQCRPISKRCKWVGFIYQKQLKTVCNWRKKSKNSIQRKCCRFFKVCRIKGKKRQCKNGKSICKWIGAEISTIPFKNCVFRPVGRFSRRKLCCRFNKVCKGKVCRQTNKRCGFTGPRYTLRQVSRCHWKRTSKTSVRRRCCQYTKHCIDKKCQISNKKCQFTGKTIQASKTKRCIWRTTKSLKHKYAYRRRFCCTYHKLTGRIVRNSCAFVGKKFFIRTTYWKKRTICNRAIPQTCCSSAFKCVYVGKNHRCQFFKKLGCQTHRPPRVVYQKQVRRCKTNKKSQKCCLYRYKCVGKRTFGKRLHGKCKLIKKSNCSTTIFKRNHTFTCHSVGDPHYLTFSKKYFDFYTPGDWILAKAKTKSFVVSTRTKKWGRASVNVRLAARVNKYGETVEVKARSFDVVKVNKNRLINLKVGHVHKFYYGGQIIRNSKNHITVTSANGDIVTAYTFDMGAAGKQNRVPFIMNIFMKVSNKNKYIGLCADNNKFYKSKDFSKRFDPKPDNKPPKPCTGHLRNVVERQCKRKFRTKNLLRGCIIDLCSNVPLEIEQLAVKEAEKLKKLALQGPAVPIDRRRIDGSLLQRSGSNNMCVSWGDPHFKSFSGKKFDNYQLGDFLLLKSKIVTVVVRQRRWGSASVNVRFAAKINGALIEANRPENFLLNKKERINIKVGQTITLPRGGRVERVDASRWFIISRKGGYIDVRFFFYGGPLRVGKNVFQRRYINFVIKVPQPRKTKGFCAGQTIRTSKLFKTAYKSKHQKLVLKAISPKCKKSARIRCLNRHVQRSDLRNCISDVCRGFKAKNIVKFEKNVRHDGRRWNKVFKNLKVKRNSSKQTKIHFQRFSNNKKRSTKRK